MNSTSKNMKGQYGQIRYSSWNFIQDILFFVINYFFSFPENVKKALQSILCLRRDPWPAFDSVPLKIVNTKYLHAFELDQDHFSESYDEHLQMMNLKRPRLILYPMLSLKIMTYIYQDFMVNATTSVLRDMYLILSLFLIFLKLMKKMLVLGFLLFLCKAKSRVGSKPYLMQASQISSSLLMFSSIDGW